MKGEGDIWVDEEGIRELSVDGGMTVAYVSRA